MVLGIGNLLLGDDGVGVHVVRALHGDPGLPAGTRLVDGGTGGLALLPVLSDASALVLVDAVEVDAGPGTVCTLTDVDRCAELIRLSVHQLGAADLFGAARLSGSLPERTVLVGVRPGSLEPGLRLSAPVAAALPKVLATVREWAHRLAGPRWP